MMMNQILCVEGLEENFCIPMDEDNPKREDPKKVSFKDIGGLAEQISSLKDLILLPYKNPEIFSKFGLDPPKGLLFHGPPGTGKTLVAKALANECSTEQRQVAFFARNSTDFIDKYVGETERMLRQLFDQARKKAPSIIFIDELDGLVSKRNLGNIQFYTSVVCQLLSLMNGLENNGDVIVIGATNRLHAIDPALRRPGRFDRELYFPYPDINGRKEILRIYTKNWMSESLESLIQTVAQSTQGFSGADLKALCVEAVYKAVKRCNPDLYEKQIHVENVCIRLEDFEKAKETVPKSQNIPNKGLPTFLKPLLENDLKEIIKHIDKRRLLIVGDKIQTKYVLNALIQNLEESNQLFTYRESLENVGQLVNLVTEMSSNKSKVLCLGDISHYWKYISIRERDLFESILYNLGHDYNVTLIATAQRCTTVPKMFSHYRKEVYKIEKATKKMKREFFRQILPPQSRKRKSSDSSSSPSSSFENDETNLELILEEIVKTTKFEESERVIDLYHELAKITKTNKSITEITKAIKDELTRFTNHLE